MNAHHNRTPFLKQAVKKGVHIVNFLEISGLIHGKIGMTLYLRFVGGLLARRERTSGVVC